MFNVDLLGFKPGDGRNNRDGSKQACDNEYFISVA